MVHWKLSSLLLLSLRALTVFADVQVEAEELIEDEPVTPNLQVAISATFPQAESIFGVKLVNGLATQAVLNIENLEPEAVSVNIVGGSLMHAGPEPVILRNLTASRYQLAIPAGESETLTYSFSTEMHPQEVRLQLVAVVRDSKDAFYTMSVYNQTVSVVEAPTSIFDPQIIFLYLVLLGAFGGTCFFIYNTWITTLFPQKKRTGEPRAKKPVKKVEPLEGAEPVATTTGSKKYDESWIPAQHLQRPEAKRVGSSRSRVPKTKPEA